MTDWKEITDPEELFRLKREGYEIEFFDSLYDCWLYWDGKSWFSNIKHRARPPQPKMKKVKSLCWRHSELGNLSWWVGEDFLPLPVWQRFPAGDIEGEVPDDK